MACPPAVSSLAWAINSASSSACWWRRGALLVLPAAQMASFNLFLPACSSWPAASYCCSVGQSICQPARCAIARRQPAQLRQAVNSLGHTLGPYVAGALIFSATLLSADQLAALPAAERVQTVQPLYIGVAVALSCWRWRCTSSGCRL
jgi:FHS family L-fucose permease-like MFS transporter